MNVKLTDDAVAGLPLSHGRAELLEEIMRTPVLDERPVRTEAPKHRTRWLVPAVAAVLVAALALGTAWWAGGNGPGGDAKPESAEQPAAGDHVLLDAPGWTVTAMYSDGNSGELSYENGKQSLEVMWGPAKTYEMYVDDRRHIVDPAADGDPVTVLGADAQMWAYSRDDHTAIRKVEDGRWIELRGSGMGEADYLALLGQLRLVDQATFEAALPDAYVTRSERESTISDMLDGIESAAGDLWPAGTASSISSEQTDPYQLGAEVTGMVACAWLDDYADAQRAGDQQRMDRAAAVLASSRGWPVLQEMSRTGGYPDVLWDYADQVNAGTVPEGYQGGLGCAPPSM